MTIAPEELRARGPKSSVPQAASFVSQVLMSDNSV